VWAVLPCACLLVAAGAAAEPREMASPAECQKAVNQPAVQTAESALKRDPAALEGYFKLADAWSDAGCFHEALRVLQTAEAAHFATPQLTTRLRVARSLVGEERFFDNLERADAEVKVQRAVFRCTSLGDLDSCNAAVEARPGDAALLAAQRAALEKKSRPDDGDKVAQSAAIAPAAAQAAPRPVLSAREVPVVRPHYSNAAQGDQSH